jgi:F-type H+-transporting ATPase subunit b
MIELDRTLIVQLINFLVFLIVLNAIFLKPVGAAIAKRRAYIDGVARNIDALEADVKTLGEQAEERRAAARRQADATIAAARSAAQNDAAALAQTYATHAAQLVEEAHATVAREVATAREAEASIVESLAETLLARAIEPGLAA